MEMPRSKLISNSWLVVHSGEGTFLWSLFCYALRVYLLHRSAALSLQAWKQRCALNRAIWRGESLLLAKALSNSFLSMEIMGLFSF